MKRIHTTKSFVIAAAMIFAMPIANWAKTIQYPDETPEGLVRVKDAKADAVYVLPGVDLSHYTMIKLDEPRIAFRSGWQREMNTQHGLINVSDDDMDRIKDAGRDLLEDAFENALKDEGFKLTDDSGKDVLLVRASIVDLEINAPNLGGTSGAWKKIYTEGAGSATMILEFYDSKSEHLIARAYDRKDDSSDAHSWQTARTAETNVKDAKRAFASWAKMLAHGLSQTKIAKH